LSDLASSEKDFAELAKRAKSLRTCCPILRF
jgi:hypothetical protein